MTELLGLWHDVAAVLLRHCNNYTAGKVVLDVYKRQLWDTTGANNRFDEPGATSFPPVLPGGGWPGFLRTAYGNVFKVLTGLLG